MAVGFTAAVAAAFFAGAGFDSAVWSESGTRSQ